MIQTSFVQQILQKTTTKKNNFISFQNYQIRTKLYLSPQTQKLKIL